MEPGDIFHRRGRLQTGDNEDIKLREAEHKRNWGCMLGIIRNTNKTTSWSK